MTQKAPSRPPGTIRIGSLAGIDVLVTSSWFIIAGLIAFAIAPRIEQVEPGLGALKYVAGLVFAIVLYLSVLLHEASHAIVAQRFGFGVNSITLHFLGGMTEIDGSARRPRQEFWIAVVGPLTSIAVGLASVGLLLPPSCLPPRPPRPSPRCSPRSSPRSAPTSTPAEPGIVDARL